MLNKINNLRAVCNLMTDSAKSASSMTGIEMALGSTGISIEIRSGTLKRIEVSLVG